MPTVEEPESFSSFRNIARQFLRTGVAPEHIRWSSGEKFLFEDLSSPALPFAEDTSQQTNSARSSSGAEARMSRQALRILELASMFRAPDRYSLLYSAIWNNQYASFDQFLTSADAVALAIQRRRKQVSRDIHKMHAFVRFSEYQNPKLVFKELDSHKLGESLHKSQDALYAAWYQPQHLIVRAATPFFLKRFGQMKFAIFTPEQTAISDGHSLRFEAGYQSNPLADTDDPAETLWLAYYSSIFNPARIKIQAMKNEMPTRYWSIMPETKLIPRLLQQAPARLQEMKERSAPNVYVPKASDITALSEEMKGCTRCQIACLGGQVVPGEGPHYAKIMIIGEQPGDMEDQYGRPFVGPAGDILNRALRDASLDRKELYITNAVKHFKWKPRGKIRLHQRPSGLEILSCKPWIIREIEIVKPSWIICMGVSAAQSVLGIQLAIAEVENTVFDGPQGSRVLVTYHPSAILRADASVQEARFQKIVEAFKEVD